MLLNIYSSRGSIVDTITRLARLNRFESTDRKNQVVLRPVQLISWNQLKKERSISIDSNLVRCIRTNSNRFLTIPMGCSFQKSFANSKRLMYHCLFRRYVILCNNKVIDKALKERSIHNIDLFSLPFNHTPRLIVFTETIIRRVFRLSKATRRGRQPSSRATVI